MYYDFYEPSEFDSQIEEFKDFLRKSVKVEILEELETLRKENESLRDIKNRIHEIEREHSRTMQSARQEAMRMKFANIIKACSEVYYAPEMYSVQQPKCDRCNDKRMIKYTTPLGRTAEEYCTCYDKRYRYRPVAHYVCEISNRSGAVIVWHKKPHDDEEGWSSSKVIKPEDICDDKDFADIPNTWNAYFRNEDMCQAYCDWLNVRQENKEKENEAD